MAKDFSKRHFQVGETIKRHLSLMFSNGDFEYQVSDLFSVLEVRPSKAFETAVVFISVFDEKKTDEVIKKLNGIAGEVRYRLANNTELRSTPRLIFKRDSAEEYAKNIDEILSQISD